MTKAQAMAIARREAERRGWPWEEPVFVSRERRWIVFGALRWRFMTNASYRGGNVNVTVDDGTGQVVSAGFARR